MSDTAEPAGLLPCKQKTLARQHPAAFPPNAHSVSCPLAPAPRPPTARANGHRPTHGSPASCRSISTGVQYKDGRYFPEKWLLDWNDEARSLWIWEYFTELPAVIEFLKNNEILTKDIYPSYGAITAALDEILNQQPDNMVIRVY